jgi:hypothetical protein
VKKPTLWPAFGAVLMLAAPARSQTYVVSWTTVDTGGAMGNAGGTFVLGSTAGQHDAGGPVPGPPYVLAPGFWGIAGTAGLQGKQADTLPARRSSKARRAAPRAESELIHGSSLWADLDSQHGTTGQGLFRIHQAPHSSYEVLVDSASGDLGTGGGPGLDRLGSDAASVRQSSQPAGAGSARSLRWFNPTGSTVDDELVRVRGRSCASDCDRDDVYRIRAYETTYRISRFNNLGTHITVIVIQNVSSDAVSGEIAFWAAGTGTLLHVEPFSLAGHASLVLGTAGVRALQDKDGSVTVSHDAPYGQLAGKAVTFEPAIGFVSDTEMCPRMP